METIGKAAKRASAGTRKSRRESGPPAVRGSLPAVFVMQTDRTIPDSTWAGFTASGERRKLRRPLTPEERRLLEWRVASLRPHLAGFARPGDEDAVIEALAGMFGSFSSMRDVEGAAVSRLASTMVLLEEFPAWGIIETCASIRMRGYTTLKDGVPITERRWPPSDPDLHHAVAAHVQPRAMALRNAEQLLAAPVEPQIEETAEQRAAAVARWNAHKAGIVGADQVKRELRGKPVDPERAEQIVAESYERAGVDRPKGITASLEMLIACGWKVEDHFGRKILAPPPEEWLNGDEQRSGE